MIQNLLRKIIFIFFISSIAFSLMADEQMNITTYHPSAQGNYEQITVTDRMHFNSADPDHLKGNPGDLLYYNDNLNKDSFYLYTKDKKWEKILNTEEILEQIEEQKESYSVEPETEEVNAYNGETCVEACAKKKLLCWKAESVAKISPNPTIIFWSFPCNMPSSYPYSQDVSGIPVTYYSICYCY